jgi:hypothetical protein
VTAEANKQLMRAIFAELETGKGALFAATLADNVSRASRADESAV